MARIVESLAQVQEGNDNCVPLVSSTAPLLGAEKDYVFTAPAFPETILSIVEKIIFITSNKTGSQLQIRYQRHNQTEEAYMAS